MANYLYLVAFNFSGYQEYVGYAIYSFLYLLGTFIFYLIFLEIYGEKFIKISEMKKDNLFINLYSRLILLKHVILKHEKKIRQIIGAIFIIVIIAVLFVGNYYLKTTAQFVKEEPNKLVINDLFVNRSNNNLSGTLFVSQNYTLKFGLIPWGRIRLNISSVESDNVKTPDYNFSGNYLYIKNSSWNTISVELYGWKQEYNISEFHTLKINDLNNTIQRWDINFYNPHPYDIYINEVVVEMGNQLRYNNYTRDNLAPFDIVNNPTDHYIVIQHVWLPRYWLPQYANHSITLFFEKNKT